MQKEITQLKDSHRSLAQSFQK
jgi:hypothetical protein